MVNDSFFPDTGSKFLKILEDMVRYATDVFSISTEG